MSELVCFFIVITIQFIFFAVHAFIAGERDKLFRYLKHGMVLGLPFGIIIDLIFGHWLGLWDYTLGYTWWFLIINGILSYGFMIANVFLLKHHSIINMYTWSVGLGVVYETANYLLPVWEWTFHKSTLVELAAVVLVGYAGLSILLMGVMRVAYKFHFRLLPF